MIRSVALPLWAVLAVLFGDFGCWAEPPHEGTPAPTAPITAEQRAATRALLIDAMLDPADIPIGLAERGIGREEASPPNLESYLDNGWLMFVTNAWLGDADPYLVQETVYAFEDEARAAAFLEQVASEMAELPGVTELADLPPGAVGYERTFTRQDENERRSLDMAAVKGRLVISLDHELAANRDDWREAAGSLLSAAEERAQEALTAAGS